MSSQQVGSLLLIIGSLVFLAGAALGVPSVFRERDRERRMQLLAKRLTAWRAAQPLYALGPLLVSVGVAVIGASSAEASKQVLLLVASVALFVGALSWAWSVYLRGTRVADFAYGRLPAWPFTIYIWLTIGGLGLFGIALLAGTFPAWSGWLVLVSDVVFLLGYIRLGDLPPFVFYVLLFVVAIGLL